MRYFFLVFIIILASCTVKMPDIKVTGEKTALENQVLGNYKKIKEEAWIVASERGNVEITEIPKDNKKITEAIRNREFNKDDVTQFRLEEIFGETRNCEIEIYDKDKYNELSKEKKALADKVMIEENNDRAIILDRLYQLDPNTNKLEIKEAFYNLILEEAPEDTYYKSKDGKWTRK